MTSQSQPHPEEPEYTSELQVLSPVSPKPVHFPVPSNIPVLAKQIDVGFNQTGPHMSVRAAEPSQSVIDATPIADSLTTKAMEMEEAGEQNQDGDEMDLQETGDGGSLQEFAQTTDADSGMNLENGHIPHTESQTHVAADGQVADEASLLPIPNPEPNVSENPSPSDVNAPSYDPAQDTVIPAEPNGTSTVAEAKQSTGSAINYQALLDSLSASSALTKPFEGAFTPQTSSFESFAQTSGQGAPGTIPSGLPPRPPPQAQSSMHQNYTQSDDIRNYHPHAQNSTVPQPSYPPGTTPTSSYPGAQFPGGGAGANGLPPPPVASFQQQQQQQQQHPLPAIPGQVQSPASAAAYQQQQRSLLESQRERKLAAGELLDDDDKPWTEECQRRYDAFLQEERQHVTEGNWEQFPYGSRLFVGNLSSEKVTKRDIYHVFSTYGRLAQISIKQAYGFVQFLEAGCCGTALRAEQGRTIRGKKIHLEISKPQKNRNSNNNYNNNNDQRRRSRSPEAGRVGNAPSGVDRYVSGQGRRSDQKRDGRRGRDDYRPARSPSPRAFERDRSRDRYRYRSRSRSPYARNDRYRSPQAQNDLDDTLPLPRRAPRDVPDVQMIVLDNLDRNFIGWVESAFRQRNVRVDVLLLSPRLSEAAVIKRQIIEGVTAVSKLTQYSQQTAKIPLQIFDRRGGTDVGFEEYADLDPAIAAEVVLRAMSKNQPRSFGSQMQYGYGAGITAQQQQPPPATQGPNLSNIITSLDTNGLQKLLGAMQSPAGPQQQQQQQQAPPLALTQDLARLLGGAGAQQPHQAHFGGAQDPLAALRANPALADLLKGQGTPQQATPLQAVSQPPPPPAQPDMADILARLGQYRR